MTINRTEITAEDVDGIARARPTSATLLTLKRWQATRRRMLLANLHRQLEQHAPVETAESAEVLRRAARLAPDAAARVLSAPLLNPWLVAARDALIHDQNPVAATDLLRRIAMAAAVRSGIEVQLRLSTQDGSVWLPGLGTFTGLGSDEALVSAAAGKVTAINSGGRGQFIPVRSIALGDGAWSLEIEDQHPYRSCFSHAASAPLSGADADHLTEMADQAWELLVRDHPHDALVARTALVAIVPLAGPPGGDVLSASARIAYGCVASTLPDQASILLRNLVHELRHMLLGGLQDLVGLCLEDGSTYLHAPWRMDPRPVGGLLQGAFAHIGVTEFWAAERHRERAGSPERARADFEFCYWREVTGWALVTLRDSGRLTPTGLRFVAGMAESLAPYRVETPPRAIVTAAADTAQADAIRWRILNQDTDSLPLDRLHQRLRSGAACEALDPPVVRRQPAEPARGRGLSEAIRRSAIDGGAPRAALADRSFLAGDLQAAADGYAERIAMDPNDRDAWVGLAMTVRRLGNDSAAAAALTLRPEVVQALYARRARDAAFRSPEETATWVATGLLQRLRPLC
jgi:uncharacterized protein